MKYNKFVFLVIGIWSSALLGLILYYPLLTYSTGYNTKTITTTNSSGGAIADFPVKVAISTSVEITAGRMRSDCGDIRVLNTDGVSQLNYAIIDCNTTFTSVVFVIPNLVTGTNTQYITFGDPSLTSTATPNVVFDIYTMFDSSNPTSTCTVGGNASWDNVNNWLKLTDNTANQTGTCNFNYISDLSTKGYKVLFQAWTGGTTNGTDSTWQYGFDSSVPTNEDITLGGNHFTLDEGQNRMCTTTSVTSNAACDASFVSSNLDNSTWRSMEVSWDPTRRRINENGTSRVNATTNAIAPTTTNTNFGFGGRTTTPPNEHRIRRVAVFAFSETITTAAAANSRPKDNLSFTIRNSADTAAYNLCNYGDVTSAAVANCQYRLKVSSVAGSGYSIQVTTSGSLNNGVYNIINAAPGSGGSGGSPIVAGTEKYGVSITPGSCTNGLVTTNSIFSPAVGNFAELDYTTPTTLISCSGGNQPLATDLTNTTLISQSLAVENVTPPGYYTQNITWTVIPNY